MDFSAATCSVRDYDRASDSAWHSVWCLVWGSAVITQKKAIQIAKDYAEQNGRGWDERYSKTSARTIDGEPVWMISTSDSEYSDELPWMMKHMPNPAYYYISMVEARCIAVGSREGEYLYLRND